MFEKIRSGFARASVALGAVLAGASAFAEGESNQIDTTVASGALNTLVESIKGFISTCAPYLVGLLGAALGLVLIWKVWGWIKKGTNKAG